MATLDAALYHIHARLRLAGPLTALVPPARILTGVAPDATPLPLVLVQFYGETPGDTNHNGGHRALTRAMVSVRIVHDSRSDAAAVRAADTALDVVLHGSSGNTPDGYVSSCIRMSPSRMPLVEGGRVVHYTGGLYQLVVQPT